MRRIEIVRFDASKERLDVMRIMMRGSLAAALRRISSPVLSMGITSDILYPRYQQQALVDDLDVVDEAHKQVGLERLDLVEVERAEEAVTPAEGGVCVDDDVLAVLALGDGVLERGPAERVEPAEREVEDAPGLDVGGFLVHQVADVVDVDWFALLAREGGDLLKEGLLVHPDLTRENDAHGFDPSGFCSRPIVARGERGPRRPDIQSGVETGFARGRRCVRLSGRIDSAGRARGERAARPVWLASRTTRK